MKSKSLFVLGLLLVSNITFCQKLSDILDGYTISKIPINKSIVGAKWVTNIGATTEGLDESKLTVSQSLSNLTLNKNNQGSLSLALLSNLGLSGYSSNELTVIFNKLEVYSVKDLYDLPLVKGEKVIFSSIKASSFDLIFDKNISSNVLSKLPEEFLNISGEVNFKDKKRLTITGADLFVAHKIVIVDKIKTKTKSKKFKYSDFSIENLMGYDFLFNVDRLFSKSIEQAVRDEGLSKLTGEKDLDHYISKYAKIAPIKVNITDSKRGSLGVGMFKKIKDVCYCELSDGNNHIYSIEVTNSGDEVTYDYFKVDDFEISYSVIPGASRNNFPVGILSPKENSKLSVISKTFYISKVND